MHQKHRDNTNIDSGWRHIVFCLPMAKQVQLQCIIVLLRLVLNFQQINGIFSEVNSCMLSVISTVQNFASVLNRNSAFMHQRQQNQENKNKTLSQIRTVKEVNVITILGRARTILYGSSPI